MPEFLSGTRALDLVLACISIEIAALVGYRLDRGEPLLPADVLANLLAAAGLVGAARLMMAGAWWGFAGLSLLGALCAHVVALRLRWPRTAAP